VTEPCIFCEIVAGKCGTQFVDEDDALVAFEDARPIAPVHLLVVPKEHHASLTDAATGDVGPALLGRLLQAAAGIGAARGEEHGGYRVVINAGASAGQTVFHLHLHVLSGRHFAWPPG